MRRTLTTERLGIQTALKPTEPGTGLFVDGGWRHLQETGPSDLGARRWAGDAGRKLDLGDGTLKTLEPTPGGRGLAMRKETGPSDPKARRWLAMRAGTWT